MSLVTTIHITVRQKGRFGDGYIGYVPISPGNFKISPNLVTHWYKLGSKPGKSSSKLRGDLQISFQFLSEWSEQLDQSVEASMELVRAQAGMLKRSSSDVKIWMANGMGADKEVGLADEKQPGQSKGKNEILSALRRSFKRKNKPAVLKKRKDEFTSFESQSMTPTHQYLRKRSNTLMHITRSNSLCSTGRISVGQSTDSDTSVTASPLLARSNRGSIVVNVDGSSVTEKLLPEIEVEGPAASDGMVNLLVCVVLDLDDAHCVA